MSFLSLNESFCRLTNFNTSASKLEFNRLACAKCYELLQYVFKDFRSNFNMTKEGYLISEDPYVELDINNEKDLDMLKSTFHDNLEFKKWNDCCIEAKSCCSNVMSQTGAFLRKNSNDSDTCMAVWDGWSCHQNTLAGHFSKVKCPSYIVSDDCNSILDYAYFQCDSSGWFRNQHSDYEWANYSKCLALIIPIKERQIYVNIFTHSISLILLLIGLIIFCSYRKLQVNRVILHKHLFISLLFNSLVHIIWDYVFMWDSLHSSNPKTETDHIGCIMTNILLQYSRSTNYFWMFSECFYLHKLLMSVFQEELTLALYYFMGWGIPLVLTIIYVILNLASNNENCWIENYNLSYIYSVPNIAILVINLIFLANIIRLIHYQLTNCNEQNQFRRTVKAALILVPLFGSHFILSPYIMCDSTPGAEVFNLFNRIVESIQGSMVAFIYCFFNNEVTTLLKETFIKTKHYYLFKRETNTTNAMMTFNETEKFVKKNSSNSSNRQLSTNSFKLTTQK